MTLSHLLEQSTDVSGQELFRLNAMYGLPDYVKEASAEQCLGGPQTPANAYADHRQPRQFPCHTKAATLVSWVSFLEKRSSMPSKLARNVEDRLRQLGAYHELTAEFARYQDKHAELYQHCESVLPDSAFAIVRTQEDGSKERHYPLRNTQEVKAAADWFLQYRNHFEFNDRLTIADKILEKAAAFGASLGDCELDLHRQAGRGWCLPKEAAALLRSRAQYTRAAPEVRAQLCKLAESLEGQPEWLLDGRNLADLARLVDDYDRQAKVKYSELLRRPEDVLFQVTHKEASDLRETLCSTTTGSVYNREQFSKLSLAAVRDLFGADLASEVSDGLGVDGEKFATVASTFPRPDAQALDLLMSDIGQGPLAKEKRGFSLR